MSDSIENNTQCSFFCWIRKHTFYTAFKKALIDSQSLSNSDESLLKALHLMLVSGIFLLLLVLGVNFLIAMPQNSSELGTFGDFLGGVLNPIFTLMTFFGVIVTIALQKLELRAAREEYKKSADALGTQAVENTFFNMVNLHHKITSEIKFNTNGFKIEANLLADTEKHKNLNEPKYIEIKKEQHLSATGSLSFQYCIVFISRYAQTNEDVFALYKYIQDKQNNIFGHYFRNLYQIIKFIDEHVELSQNSKNKYLGILRAQLSRNELSVLYLNCMGNMVDDGKFRQLLIKYHLLEHMNIFYINNKFVIINNERFDTGPFFTIGMIPIANNETINEFLSDEEDYFGAFGKNPCFTKRNETE